LQKRSILLRSVRIEATPYIHTYILAVEVRNFNSRCPLAPPFFCRYKKYISVPHEQFIKGSLRKAPQRIFFLILNHLSTHPAWIVRKESTVLLSSKILWFYPFLNRTNHSIFLENQKTSNIPLEHPFIYVFTQNLCNTNPTGVVWEKSMVLVPSKIRFVFIYIYIYIYIYIIIYFFSKSYLKSYSHTLTLQEWYEKGRLYWSLWRSAFLILNLILSTHLAGVHGKSRLYWSLRRCFFVFFLKSGD